MAGCGVNGGEALSALLRLILLDCTHAHSLSFTSTETPWTDRTTEGVNTEPWRLGLGLGLELDWSEGVG